MYSPQLHVPTVFDLRLRMFGVTLACNHGCSKCLTDAKPNGEQMPFELISRILDSGMKLYDHGISLSFGEPLLYLQGEKDLGDVVKLFALRTHHIGILTGGICFDADSSMENALRKLERFKHKLSFTVSFDFIEKNEWYACLLANKTIQILLGHGFKVEHLQSCYVQGDQNMKARTKFLTEQLIIDNRLRGSCDYLLSEASAIGRARNVSGVREKSLQEHNDDDCDAMGICQLDTERKLGVLPNGDLTPCVTNFASNILPFGNIQKDSPAQLQIKYKEYVAELQKLRREGDPNRKLCYLHMERDMKAKSIRRHC
ncbi:MAG: radical SAM/SPASM domain-containing protein [Candidatus Micrarchaeota archaeon]